MPGPNPPESEATQALAKHARRPSLRDVAERAGVALSTASRAISGAENVRPGVRARVLEAAEELGYQRNLLAQSLRRGSSMSVGFIVRDISNPMMAHIVLGAERTLMTAGYGLSLRNSQGNPGLDADYIRYFRQAAVDGLLLSLSDESYRPTIDELTAIDFPFVAIDRALPPELSGSAVLSDHAKGTEAAARHLASLGHRRIGLIAGPGNLRPAREAARGLLEFCDSHPEISCVIEYGAFSAEFGEEATSRLLSSADRPTALISGGYQILLGVVATVRAYGLKMPNDLSLITFDDSDALPFFNPPIAALSREPFRVGQRAAELLIARLSGDGSPTTVSMTPVFRPRASCGPAPLGPEPLLDMGVVSGL